MQPSNPLDTNTCQKWTPGINHQGLGQTSFFLSLPQPLSSHALCWACLGLPLPAPPVIYSLCRAKETELKMKLFLKGKSNFSIWSGRPSGMWVPPTPLLLQPHFSSLPAFAITSLSFRPSTCCFLCLENAFSSSLPLLPDNVSSHFNLSFNVTHSKKPFLVPPRLGQAPSYLAWVPLLWFWVFVRWERRCLVSQG